MDYSINRSADRKNGYTGDLYRRMWWDVHNAAGGNKAMISFFYMKYGDFVQWGVGSRFDDPRRQLTPPQGQKLWNVPPVRSKDKSPIEYPEPYNKANGHRYASKPFLRREIMYHLSWLTKRLAEQYGYFGAYWLERSLTQSPTGVERTRQWLEQHMWELPQDFLDLFDVKRI